MERIAKFEKVSFEIFKDKVQKEFGIVDEEAEAAYERLSLPKRATSGSAGYDFFAPFDICIEPGETVIIPTGIRASMENGWVLMIFPRSGLGFKYRLMLNNTVGVIDSDYYYSDNEGHIMIKVTNLSGLGNIVSCGLNHEWYNEAAGSNDKSEAISLKAGQGFAQGVFMPFGITTDDDVDVVRNGGFGSTG
ncbi:MAG: deoxyuridine 5'-triphosphate nucleotidohydrolase [Lachnospiraceae bacterium]|nr:deoxyuridine 5'-triphosphate nucleotidohydrolase [Lachnospiraceae bacterium]